MSYLQYLKDKRFFFAFYLIIMLFVSLIMLVSANQGHTANNIVYANVGCFIFAALYITIGYYYRRAFYQTMNELSGDGYGQAAAAAVPPPQNNEQALYVALIQKLDETNTSQLQKTADEIRDHQDFIMSWIHEVKLPIAASRLLMDNSAGKSVDFLIDRLEDELGKIDNYVEQALYYSRIDSFSKDYFITEVQLSQVIKDSAKKYAKLFINKDISLHINELGQYVHSDSKWLSYIVNQIVANSLKYTPEGGRITVSFEEDGQEKRLLIEDSGIGIKLEDVNRVFEKGFTGSIGRSHAKSTGMGLYLAKKMALKLGHELSVYSEEGDFTRVTIHFPKLRNYYRL
ncbi:sensor histidine kinase [Paenibacillus mendelii]|uniref:histidine kinase n=1 Tax=Paenibacillus mendelii TaxID=206163 RepID=A0ABV6J817_9BACL|nr:sensor histidine kinase [Paenibacillus mendelii]MCQ6561325.1 sensor histidine kinase [Paenibacillus mendelii]